MSRIGFMETNDCVHTLNFEERVGKDQRKMQKQILYVNVPLNVFLLVRSIETHT